MTINIFPNLKKGQSSLDGVADLIECRPIHQEIASSIPGQGSQHMPALQA